MSLADKKGKQRPLVDGLATEATLAALSHAEDSAHVSGDKGVPMWGVRVDAFPPDGGVFGADGDYTPIATNYKGDVKVALQNTSGASINPATEEKQDTIIAALGDITIPSGAITVGQRVLTVADTWYGVPSTVPTSDYILIVTLETAAGTIRWSPSNSSTPSTTNGHLADGTITKKMKANASIYFGSSTALDAVNWSTEII